MSDYDSRVDTFRHIEQVRALLFSVIRDLMHRSHIHDRSKLEDPEKTVFDAISPSLRHVTYGSDAYEAIRLAQAEGMNHHYSLNRHHPEYFEDGIAGMNLVDLIEMLCDWKAATLRHEDGNLDNSIEVQRERFGFGDELETLLRNTARDFGWFS